MIVCEQAAHHWKAELRTEDGCSKIIRGEALNPDSIRLMIHKMRCAQASKAVADKSKQLSAIELPEVVKLQVWCCHQGLDQYYE